MILVLVLLVLAGPLLEEPFAELQDLYKAVHQSFLGPEHAIPSREIAERYLRAEWAGLGPAAPGDTLLVTEIRGAPFVRLHLRGYRDRGGSIDSLLAAFLRSGAAPRDSARFRLTWEEVGERIRARGSRFEASAYDSLDARLSRLGYPAVHHSARYAAARRPAYRVVAREEAERLLRLLAGQGRIAE